MMHQALDDSDQTRKYDISESIMQALIMTLLQTMQPLSVYQSSFSFIWRGIGSEMRYN